MWGCVPILASSWIWMQQTVSHKVSLFAQCVWRKCRLNRSRFSIVCLESDGAACPFTTGLFCISNFRLLKWAMEASVQHCVDGWVIKTWVSCWGRVLEIDGHIVYLGWKGVGGCLDGQEIRLSCWEGFVPQGHFMTSQSSWPNVVVDNQEKTCSSWKNVKTCNEVTEVLRLSGLD